MDPKDYQAKKAALQEMRGFARSKLAGEMKKPRKSPYQTGLDSKGEVQEYGSSDDAAVQEMQADKKRMDQDPKQRTTLNPMSPEEAEELRERLRQYDHFKQVTADED